MINEVDNLITLTGFNEEMIDRFSLKCLSYLYKGILSSCVYELKFVSLSKFIYLIKVQSVCLQFLYHYHMSFLLMVSFKFKFSLKSELHNLLREISY